MCFSHDDGYAEMYERRTVVPRKRHRCESCGQWIAVGETCDNATGKFDGSMFSVYLCARCCDLERRIVAEEIAEGCVGGEAYPAWEEIYEHAIETKMITSTQLYLAPNDTLQND